MDGLDGIKGGAHRLILFLVLLVYEQLIFLAPMRTLSVTSRWPGRIARRETEGKKGNLRQTTDLGPVKGASLLVRGIRDGAHLLDSFVVFLLLRHVADPSTPTTKRVTGV